MAMSLGLGTKSPASRRRRQGVGASRIPEVVVFNGKSSMSSKAEKKNKLCVLVEIHVLAGRLSREMKSWGCDGENDTERAHGAYGSLGGPHMQDISEEEIQTCTYLKIPVSIIHTVNN